MKKSIDEEKFQQFANEQINNEKNNNELIEKIKSLTELNDKLQNKNHPIYVDKKNCLKTAISVADSLKCTYAAEKEYKKEISEYLNLLKDSMNKEQYGLIKRNQNLWIMQNKSDEEVTNKIIFSHGGSIYYQVAADEIFKKKKQRADFLKRIYEVHTDKKIDINEIE